MRWLPLAWERQALPSWLRWRKQTENAEDSNMARIGFIGLGNMGGPMAANLVKAGHDVHGHDLSRDSLDRFAGTGGTPTETAAEAVTGAEVVVTMLPAGKHVHLVYMDDGGLIATCKPGTLFIDCSTIDVTTARVVNAAAEAAGHMMLDAPVSGGITGAAAGTLTFMCGGSHEAFAAAKPYLKNMGKNIFHAGGAGNGQAAKVCNNMLLGISMIGTAEAFNLAEALGLDAQTFFDISSTASGQCWSMTTYCPAPGPVPTSPANNDYKPGFAAAMMIKDLALAADAASAADANTPMGLRALEVYQEFIDAGGSDTDFSGIIRYLKAEK
jgi:3-hydroxyisobutyrate dehydrogenase